MAEYRSYTVHLDISAEAYREMYRGVVRNVIARDLEGRRIQFPAMALRSFVTASGIQGRFVVRVDADNRLVDIQRR